MPKSLLVGLAVALLASGCATRQSASAPASLPDGRDLAEHPLDVLGIPQP